MNPSAGRKAATDTISRLPALDGLRGIAVLLVMLFHFRWIYTQSTVAAVAPFGRIFDFGWIGVDLFFVLSGFLISNILIETRDSPEYFTSFYGRRALRIFPLYYATVIVILGAGPPLLNALGKGNWWSHIHPLWYVFYLANWQPGSNGLVDPMIGHFWSLCVEEQFYLVWPTLLWLTPRKRLGQVALTVAILSFVVRQLVLQSGPGEHIYRMTVTRLDGLALGSWVAVASRSPHLRAWLDRNWKWLLALGTAGIATAATADRSFDPDGFWMQALGYTSLAIAFSMLVYLGANGSGWLFRSLTWRPLLVAGTFSYAMYVFHIPAEFLIRKHVDRALAGVPFFVSLGFRAVYIAGMIALMYAAGWISWNLFEKRLLELKRHFRYTRQPFREAPQEVAAVAPAGE